MLGSRAIMGRELTLCLILGRTRCYRRLRRRSRSYASRASGGYFGGSRSSHPFLSGPLRSLADLSLRLRSSSQLQSTTLAHEIFLSQAKMVEAIDSLSRKVDYLSRLVRPLHNANAIAKGGVDSGAAAAAGGGGAAGGLSEAK